MAQLAKAAVRQPLIVGIGGTTRAGSSTERALLCALRRVEQRGGRAQLLGGAFLGTLPIFDPRPGEMGAAQAELVAAVRAADGLIIATPGYHGSLSGVIKNALDTLEMTAKDDRPYLTGRAVGMIVSAAGAQAGGTTLVALRSIVHALRGWPTPFGAALNASGEMFDANGDCRDEKDGWQLATVADQVMDFAMMRTLADAA